MKGELKLGIVGMHRGASFIRLFTIITEMEGGDGWNEVHCNVCQFEHPWLYGRGQCDAETILPKQLEIPEKRFELRTGGGNEDAAERTLGPSAVPVGRLGSAWAVRGVERRKYHDRQGQRDHGQQR